MIRLTVAALLLISVTGCSGIKPWQPPNHREEGPTKGGLLTGPEGAWTIGVGGKVPAAAHSPVQSTPEK